MLSLTHLVVIGRPHDNAPVDSVIASCWVSRRYGALSINDKLKLVVPTRQRGDNRPHPALFPHHHDVLPFIPIAAQAHTAYRLWIVINIYKLSADDEGAPKRLLSMTARKWSKTGFVPGLFRI